MARRFLNKHDIKKSRVEVMAEGIVQAKTEREAQAFKDFREKVEADYRNYKHA